MTSYSICRAWAPVFFSILRSQETSPEVATDSYCYVDHPLKVKQSGPTRHIYAYLKVMEREGTWYAVDAWITDPSGREKLAESTFLVPTREPDSDIGNYKGEWDIFLRMFLVCCVGTQAMSNGANIEPVNEEYDQCSDCTGQTVEEGDDNEELPSLDADDLPDSEAPDGQPEAAMDRERLDDLLKPENFNWADEDEEEFSSEEAISLSKVENDESPIRVKIPDGPLIVDSSRRLGQGYVAQQESRIYEEGPFARLDVADLSDQVIQDDIDAEFRHREEMVAWTSTTDWQIHHFNWYGQAVYEYSDTPPAVSLWYIASQPKVPLPSDEMRVQSILSRATRFIDPVVYFGHDWRDLQRRGQELIRAVTGDVFKCYTLHGTWKNDERHFDGETRMDEGVKEGYGAPNYVIANGFSTHPAVMNRSEREEARRSLFEYKRNIDPFRYTVAGRRDRIYALSPLRSSASVDEEWEDESEIANHRPTVDSRLYAITEECEESNDNNSLSTQTGLEERGNMSEKELVPELQVREDNAPQNEGPNSHHIENAIDTSVVLTDDYDVTNVYDSDAYLRNMDVAQEIADKIEYPDSQEDDGSHSGSVRDQDNDQILDNLSLLSPQSVSSDHSPPEIEDDTEVGTTQQGSYRFEEHSGANLDYGDIDVCIISNPMMARRRKSIDTVAQPTKPFTGCLKKHHSLPALCVQSLSAVVSPIVDTNDAHRNDKDKSGVPTKVSDFLVYPQRMSNSDQHHPIPTTEQAQLIETATENPVQKGDQKTAISGPENGPGEDFNPTQNQQDQTHSTWKRFSHRICRIFCVQTPTEAPRSPRKLKKKPRRRVKLPSIRRTDNFILEGLSMAGPYPVEIFF